MHYFVLDGEKLLCHTVSALPVELEMMFQLLRMKYTISYYVSQWEDESTAPGQGLDYNNSYGYNREPLRSELVLQNGSLLGFYVGNDFQNPSPQHILSVSNPFICIEDKNRLACYQRWELIVEPNPSPSEYVFLSRVCRQDENHQFSIDEFPAEIVESISDSFFLEDNRGRFTGVFCLTLKLNRTAINAPDDVLDKLAVYHPILVRR
ncbi:MAG: hypothetical protein IKU34_08410 [Clostridia bacterium]|nr:hypothetical protein [Clostridia bacterium]